MMAKPIRALELHYPMIQFLLANIIMWQPRVRQNRFNCPIGISSRKTFYFSHIYKKIIIASFFGQVAEYWLLSSYSLRFLFSWTVLPLKKDLSQCSAILISHLVNIAYLLSGRNNVYFLSIKNILH